MKIKPSPYLRYRQQVLNYAKAAFVLLPRAIMNTAEYCEPQKPTKIWIHLNPPDQRYSVLIVQHL